MNTVIYKYTTLLSFLLLTGNIILAQDNIFLSDGSKTEAKIIEISGSEIKYKKFNNPDGPTFTVAKSDVTLITYQNGTSEVFNKKGGNKAADKNSFSFNWSTPDSLSKNFPTNQLSINIIDFAFTHISVAYEYFFRSGYLSIRTPVNFGLSPQWATYSTSADGKPVDPNFYYESTGLLVPFKSYAVFMGGLELNYYPFGQGTYRYFAGLGINYGEFNYRLKHLKVDSVFNPPYPYPIPNVTVTKTESFRGQQTAVYINNGLLIQLNKNFNISAIAGLGLSNQYTKKETLSSPTFLFSINMGIRF